MYNEEIYKSVSGFTGSNALKLWPIAEILIKRATDRDQGRSSLETIKKLVEENKAVLWMDKNLKMALVTTEEVYPTGKKSLFLRVCSGKDLDICKKAFPMIKQYAKDIGCDCIEVFGRKGWKKVIPELIEDYSVMRLDV